MGQPKPLCSRLRGKGCALPKGAVSPLTGLVFLLRKGIGGIAYQQVCVMRRLQIIRAGGRIAGKYHAQPLARGAQHLRRLHRSALHGNALPFLQQLPLLHRHPQRLGLLRRKFACTGQLQPVAKAFTRCFVANGTSRAPAGQPSLSASSASGWPGISTCGFTG